CGEEFVTLALDEASVLSPPGKNEFWQTIFDKLREYLPADPSPAIPEPMGDNAAKAFGETKFPFGAHRGKRIDEVPLSYLVFVADDNAFRQQLRRYLRSPRIQREMESSHRWIDE
ncbi:MAG TPA: hypothetical protein VG713_20955, partial [Pirellulales bacterium]|nr:hypothetical protein [Pirellulales bacterium]